MSLLDDLIAGEGPQPWTKGMNAVLPAFQGLVRTGSSFNQALAAVREAGLRVNDKGANALWNALLNQQASRDYVSSVNKGARLDPSRLPASVTSLRKNFSYPVKITAVDIRSQEQTVNYYTITSNNVLSQQEAVDQALAQFNKSYKGRVSDSAGQINGPILRNADYEL